jgi:hypothetical protein
MIGTTLTARSVIEWTLAASAVALGVVALGGVVSQSVADLTIERAEEGATVSTVGDMTILTGEGQGEDVVYVLDNTAERLMIYRLSNPERIEYLETLSLQRVFIEGRRRFGRER